MLKNISRVLIIILISVLQTTFFQFFDVNNVSPNLFIITIVSISALRGRTDGLIFGVSFGLIQDILFGQVVGFYVLIYVLIATLAGYLYRNYYAESVVIPLIAIGVGDFMFNNIVYILTYLLRGRLDSFYYTSSIMIPELTYTIVIGVILYRLFILYSHLIDNYEKTKRKGDDDFYERNI